MARSSKHKNAGPRHVRICHFMMDSQAWKSLGPTERAVYLDMAKRYAGVGSNNGRIGYSVREAATELHIGTSTAKRALDALQDRGFIVATKKGAFSLKLRNSTEWRLTEFHCDVTNKLATKDFMTWTPDKNKPRYLQRHRSVPVAASVGISGGTAPDSDTSHGICSGTVNGGLAA
jgi:hypothetical protein